MTLTNKTYIKTKSKQNLKAISVSKDNSFDTTHTHI